MNISFSYDKGFVHEYNTLEKELPYELMKLEGISRDDLDIVKFTKQFMESNNNANASIDSNANVGTNKSIVSYTKELTKPFTKLDSYHMLWNKLKTIYSVKEANEILTSIVSGDIYVHDSTNMNLPYCFNYTAFDIVTKGLGSWTGVEVKKPKTLTSFIRQVINALISAGSLQVGATGIADLNIFTAWFVERILSGLLTENDMLVKDNFKSEELFEKAVWSHVKTVMTSFIYDVNFNYRGEQSLFTNVSLYDDIFLEKILSEINMPELPTKIDINVVKKVQDLYIDIFNEELERSVLTYPVTTATISRTDLIEYTVNGKHLFRTNDNVEVKKLLNSINVKIDELEIGSEIIIDGEKLTVETITEELIEKNHIQDKKFLRHIVEKNMKYDWMNTFFGESSVLSSCCRLRSDKNAFEKESFGSIGGSGSAKIGSLGVVTINLPRIAFKLSKGLISDFDAELKKLTEMTVKINFAKRENIKGHITEGLIPIYTEGLMDIKRQFLTSGILGVYDTIDILGKDIRTSEGLDFAKHIITVIEETHDSFKDGMYDGIAFNVEGIPAESTAVKLAQKDIVMGYNDGSIQIYANQFIPLNKEANILDRIRLNGELDSLFSGGSILHLSFDQNVESIDDMVDFYEYVAKSGTMYFAINKNIGFCNSCKTTHVYNHLDSTCPKCSSDDVEIYQRVVGFLVKVDAYSKTRYEEDYLKRTHYKSLN